LIQVNGGRFGAIERAASPRSYHPAKGRREAFPHDTSARPAMRWHAAPRNVTDFEKVSLIHRKVTASDRELARDFLIHFRNTATECRRANR
jgi:hypothetical protein